MKQAVWRRYANYRNHPEIAQCFTCSNLVLIPEAIRDSTTPHHIKHYIVNGVKKELSGTAEYGHLISEKNGGLATIDNLIIQCKRCNVKQGSKNIDALCAKVGDCEMLDDFVDDQIMGENIEYCQARCATGAPCKNQTSFGRQFCSVHLR